MDAKVALEQTGSDGKDVLGMLIVPVLHSSKQAQGSRRCTAVKSQNKWDLPSFG